MPIDVQVLSVSSTEMNPSVILSTESQRYIFNVGEGLQRFCMEHRVRLAKMQHVLLTQLDSSTIGGLPGLILTVSDIGKKGLKIAGPNGTKSFMHATRHFLYRPNFKMEIEDLENGSQVVKDDDLNITAVVLAESNPIDSNSPNKRMKITTKVSVSYIGETKTQRGKFLIHKALALGVPKGPLCGALHRGEDITVEVNGESKLIKSSDCVSPSVPGTAFAIVPCPSIDFIPSLVEEEHFKRYQGIVDEEKVKMALLVHLGNDEVLSHPRYVAWVKTFGKNVQHILVNHSECPQWTVFRASTTLQAQLNHVFPANFAQSHHEQAPLESVDLEFGTAAVGQSLLKFNLVPSAKQGFDRSSCFQPLDLESIKIDTDKVLSDAKITTTSCTDSDGLEGRVTFLGTGSALPSKYRNVTSNLIEFGKNVMLLDSGEGCFGQIFRYAAGDTKKFDELMTNLHFVWISHNHADHHLGLIRLLTERDEKLAPLVVVGPTPVYYWLHNYALVDPTIANKYIFENNMAFDVNANSDKDLDPFGSNISLVKKTLLEQYAISSFECVPVKHCHMSFAVVLTHTTGFKLAFSGDCRPSDLLVKYAENADILIHEATFEESMVDEAKKKDHSTTQEAIDVGMRAKVKHILLTHFSQRYPKMPNLTSDTLEKVASGLDLMSLSFQSVYVPNMMLVCQALMPSGSDAMEEDV